MADQSMGQTKRKSQLVIIAAEGDRVERGRRKGKAGWPATARSRKGSPLSGSKGVLRSTSQFTLAIFRTQLFGPDDMPNVAEVQDGYRVNRLPQSERRDREDALL